MVNRELNISKSSFQEPGRRGKRSRKRGILASCRVLDLTNERGFLCGKILAELGADVIKIEPPGGDEARRIGPFYRNQIDPEKSLYWLAFNVGKRGITLNLECRDGQEILKLLVKKAQFLIESFTPGFMASHGLNYGQMEKINPSLIMTSITPFGQKGPQKDYLASDLICMAMGGLVYVTGDTDRPPVRISFPQAYLHGSLEAAAGSMIAHFYRLRSGQGQQVDVSITGSIHMDVAYPHIYWEMEKRCPKRLGTMLPWGTGTGAGRHAIYRCKDGFITYILYGGSVGAQSNAALVKWMDDEGMTPDFLKNKDWSKFDLVKATQDELDRYAQAFAQFFVSYTKEEIIKGALERDMMCYPVATVKDILEDPQLQAREFWWEVPHPELRIKLLYPGPFAKFSETPLMKLKRAPHIGEHNMEIYRDELGFSTEEIISLRGAGIL